MSKYYIQHLEIFNQITDLVIREDGACIPMSEDNADFLDYLRWVEEGNTAEEWQPEKDPE